MKAEVVSIIFERYLNGDSLAKIIEVNCKNNIWLVINGISVTRRFGRGGI